MNKNEIIGNKAEEKDSRVRRILLYIIIIIIIILLLITSCSCTSRFFGRIGNRFTNEGTHVIDGSNELEVIRNKDLIFDYNHFDISLSDEFSKIRFSYSKINPSKFTCKTSDASIATCYVKDNHVIIIPKKPGTVTVTVRTEANDKIYEATTEVTIMDAKRGIVLSEERGTINLSYGNKKEVYYHLVGIIGNVTIKSSDENVAKAITYGNKIIITGLKTGSAKFTITVIDNGHTYEAEYIINVIKKPISNNKKDSNSKLSNLTVSEGVLKPVFNSNNKNYEVTVPESTEKITIKATPSSNKAKVVYIFNNKEYKEFNNIPIQKGNNSVLIKVIAEDNTTSTYTVVIKRPNSGTPVNPDDPKPPVNPDLSSDATLINLTVDKGVLTPSFKKETEDYKVTVPSNVNTITITATPNDKATVKYIYNDEEYTSFTNMGIITGKNIVNVVVTAEDGTQKTYTIEITKEKDTNNNLSSLSVGNGTLSPEFNKDTLTYEVILPYETTKNTVIGVPESSSSKVEYFYNNEKYTSFNDVTLTKDNNIIFVVVTAEDGSTKTYTVNIHRYYLNGKQNYTMSYDSATKETDIILNTNIFNDAIDIKNNSDKNIKICSKKDSSICAYISTDSSIIEKLEYTGEFNHPTSLSIKTTAASPGIAYIHVYGEVGGVKISDFYIEVSVLEKYIVTLDASGGLFNEFSKDVYTFKLSLGDEPFDLSEAGIPYLIDKDNPCYYHEFIGYAKAKNSTELFKTKDDLILSYNELDGDLTLYAIYNMEDLTKLEEEHKTVWLSEVPIFIDKAFYEMYHKDKMIAPGSYGDYKMHIKNESKTDITITGMTLKEDTICVNKNGISGCLNIGYVVKDLSKNQNFHFHNNHDYKILNTYATDKHWNENWNKIKFDFDASTASDTTIKAGEELDFILLWKWVEIDKNSDKIDTLIGNQAANKLEDPNLNDMYRLYIGIHYDTKIENCNKN